MTKPNAPRSRPYRLGEGGRAKTCQVSLSPLQAAWLASQGIPASAVLRMLVDDAMAQDKPVDLGDAIGKWPGDESDAEIEFNEPGAQAGPWVIMAKDHKGRCWFFDVATGSDAAWDVRLSVARQYDTAEGAAVHAPPGCQVLTVAQAIVLAENDARVDAAVQPSLPGAEVSDE